MEKTQKANSNFQNYLHWRENVLLILGPALSSTICKTQRFNWSDFTNRSYMTLYLSLF